MPIPTRIRFHGLAPSEAIESDVRRRVARLERYDDSIVECEVTIELPHRHHRQGHVFRVRIDLDVAGARLVVSREAGVNHAHEDARVALRDAFDAIRRELQDHVRRRRGSVKVHEPGASAVVARLFPEDGYGFLRTSDGREIYFHAHSVVRDGFSRLTAGRRVRFVEEAGEKGPQASTVVPLAGRARVAAPV